MSSCYSRLDANALLTKCKVPFQQTLFQAPQYWHIDQSNQRLSLWRKTCRAPPLSPILSTLFARILRFDVKSVGRAFKNMSKQDRMRARGGSVKMNVMSKPKDVCEEE